MRSILITTTAIALCFGAAATAGTLGDPVIEPEVIVTASTSSSSGAVLPLLLLLLAGAVIGSGGGGAPSDRRLKEGIQRVGTTLLGLPLYRFRYRGLPQVFEGVMAQDVAVIAPGAIRALGRGYMAVDYQALGLKMRRVA